MILGKENVTAWIAPQTEFEKALAMLGPYPSEKMVAYPVNSVVNTARHDGPECIASIGADGT